MNKVVEKMYEENKALITLLEQQGEISYKAEIDDKIKKIILLSAASLFEHEITEILIEYVSTKSGHDNLLVSFVKNKALSRQFHTLFQWNGNNANQFWGLFGEEFKTEVNKKITPEIEAAIKAFLEIGNMRNCLVHQNFASYYIDKTMDEIYRLYQIASKFTEFLRDVFIKSELKVS